MLNATTNTVPTSSIRISTVVGLWLSVGITLATTGVLGVAPFIGPAFVIASALGWTIAYRRSERVRHFADALPMRALVAAHAVRLPIGAVFLWEESRGQLAPLFAQRAGWGDIAVGAVAIGVALFAAHKRSVVRAFAWFGLVDILVALGTAMYLLFIVQDPLMLAPIARLPYPLLPLAIVPLVVVTHLLMLARTRR